MMKHLKKFKRFKLLETLFYLNKKESVKKNRRVRKESERKDQLFAVQNPEFKPLHKKSNDLRSKQIGEWSYLVSCDRYYYKDLKKKEIRGIKPTERTENYSIEQFFDKSNKILDLGSNSGFIDFTFLRSKKHYHYVDSLAC